MKRRVTLKWEEADKKVEDINQHSKSFAKALCFASNAEMMEIYKIMNDDDPSFYEQVLKHSNRMKIQKVDEFDMSKTQ